MADNQLAEFRKFIGVSQREFAKALGVSHALIGNYESGRTPLTEMGLSELLKPLDVPADNVIEGHYKMSYSREQFFKDCQARVSGEELDRQLEGPNRIITAVIEMVKDEKAEPVAQRAQLKGLTTAAKSLVAAVGTEAINRHLAVQKRTSAKLRLTIGELNQLFEGLGLEGDTGGFTEGFLTAFSQMSSSATAMPVYTLTVINKTEVAIHEDVDPTLKALKLFLGECNESASV